MDPRHVGNIPPGIENGKKTRVRRGALLKPTPSAPSIEGTPYGEEG